MAKADQNLTKLKLALAAGGLITTLIGAGLLGKQADAAVAVDGSGSVTTTTVSSSGEASYLLPELDLELEAVPTVAAPTFRGAAVANGRSSG